MPWHHLYTSSGGGSVSAGLIQFGNRWRLSASYHRYWSRYASVIFSSGSIVVHRDQVRVEVHELDRHLLERALRQQVALDAGERLVRVVVRLLDQAKLLALRLVEADAGRVDSLSRSSARMSSFVSCLYESGGNGMGENLRLSSQCTVVV